MTRSSDGSKSLQGSQHWLHHQHLENSRRLLRTANDAIVDVQRVEEAEVMTQRRMEKAECSKELKTRTAGLVAGVPGSSQS